MSDKIAKCTAGNFQLGWSQPLENLVGVAFKKSLLCCAGVQLAAATAPVTQVRLSLFTVLLQ